MTLFPWILANSNTQQWQTNDPFGYILQVTILCPLEMLLHLLYMNFMHTSTFIWRSLHFITSLLLIVCTESVLVELLVCNVAPQCNLLAIAVWTGCERCKILNRWHNVTTGGSCNIKVSVCLISIKKMLIKSKTSLNPKKIGAQLTQVFSALIDSSLNSLTGNYKKGV